MTKRPTILLSACEPSGDALGAALIPALSEQLGQRPDFVGIGGPKMVGQGFQSLFPIEDLALMGIAEIVPKIPMVMSRLSELEALTRVAKPDLVVTIDSPGFNTRFAKRLSGLSCPVVQYVAPQVWAWRANRVFAMSEIFNEVLCLLPFEPSFFEAAGLKASFVGHSVVSSYDASGDKYRFYERFSIAASDPILLILPGSRTAEISRLTPIFGAALDPLWRAVPTLKVVVPTLPHKEQQILDLTRDWPIKPLIVSDPQGKSDAFAAARAAMAASGTVALELALAGVPMVVAYQVNRLTAHIVKRLMRVPYVNLVNLLLEKPLVPELIQDNLTPESLVNSVLPLIKDDQVHAEQKVGLHQAMVKLGLGGWTPQERAAEALIKYLV